MDVSVETIVATSWDSDTAPGVCGMPQFGLQVQGFVPVGLFTDAEATRWLATLEEEARADRFFVSLTMFAVAGTKPNSRADVGP